MIGVHEATLRVMKMDGYVGLGVVPATAASNAASEWEVTYVYYSGGAFSGAGRWVTIGTMYGAGDVIMVRLDLDTNTVAFQKNDVSVGEPQKIAPGGAYHFAFTTKVDGNAVTIIDGRD